MTLQVTAITTDRQEGAFDLFEKIDESLVKNKVNLETGDILVISSKYISNSQGRIIDLNSVITYENGKEISSKFQMNPKIAEVVSRESDKIFGGIPGFVITTIDDIMAPNAGIDKSNVKNGKIILYPNDSYKVAEELRRKIFLKYFVHVGIIIVDSRLMPARVGTTGVAIACAGIEPVNDMRAQKDLDDNPLKVTLQAVVDNLATIGNHKMGEGSESKPIAIIRNSGAKLTDRKINPNEVAISHDQCVYVRGLNSN